MLKRNVEIFVCMIIVAISGIVSAQENTERPGAAGPFRIGGSQGGPSGGPGRAGIKAQYHALEEKFGLRILFDQKLRDEQVTENIDGLGLRDSLEALAQSAGFFYDIIDADTILVAEDTPQNRREYEELVIKLFALENVEIATVDKVLRSLIEARRLATVSEPPTLILRDTAPKVKIAERLVDLLDRPLPEVDVAVQIFEFDRLRLAKALAPAGGDNVSSMRLPGKQLRHLVKSERASLVSETRLSMVQGKTSQYSDHRSLGVRFELEIGAEVHARSGEVTLETKLQLDGAPNLAEGEETQDPAIQELQTSMRLADGTTYLLTGLTREPPVHSTSVDEQNRVLVVALTPRIVREASYEAGELEDLVVGTESRISFGDPLDAFIDRIDPQ